MYSLLYVIALAVHTAHSFNVLSKVGTSSFEMVLIPEGQYSAATFAIG